MSGSSSSYFVLSLATENPGSNVEKIVTTTAIPWFAFRYTNIDFATKITILQYGMILNNILFKSQQ